MPDMNTLKITYLSESPLKNADCLLTAIMAMLALLAIYEIFCLIKLFIKKDKDCDDCDESIDRPLLATVLSIIPCFYLLFGFTAPYADVCVQVVPNMDIREFDMNHSRDFIKKGDDYYFVKTIEGSLFNKSHAQKDEKGLSDVIKWSIERSVRGTREGDK